MDQLSELLKKKRTTSIKVRRAVREEFLDRGYKPSKKSARAFSEELEKEHPGINRWVAINDPVSHRNIEDIVMDEFEIPGKIS